MLGLMQLVALNLVSFNAVGDIVEKRAKVSSLKELVEGNQLESCGRTNTESGRKRSTRELSTGLDGDLLLL